MPLANPELVPYLEPVDELVSALKTRAQTAEAQVTALQSQVAGDAGTLAGDDSHIAALTSQVADLGEQIASLSVLVPSRTMYDGASTIIPQIPTTADFVCAGPAWKAKDIAAAKARCPNAQVLVGSRNVTSPAMLAQDFFDCEVGLTGGFTKIADAIAAAAVYVKGHLAATGQPGIVYYWQGNEAALLAACGDTAFYRWVADHTGKDHRWPGADITQWTGPSSGAAVDTSTVHNPLMLRAA